MKLVIISVPNNVDRDDIKRACAEFADVLELPTLKVNVLDEADIRVESANELVVPIINTIYGKCNHPNNLVSVANFWRLVSTGEINKGMLQTLATHRNATKAYLKQKQLERFLELFDAALKQM